MAYISTQELRFAQKDIYTAGKHIAYAGLRLRDTKFERDYIAVYEAMQKLNHQLTAAINGK